MDPNPNMTSPDPLAKRKAAAEARVASALDHLEEAQRLVERARQELSSVCGMAAEHRRLGALYGQVKGCWHAVRERASRLQGRLVLDHEPRGEEGGER